MLLDFSHIRNIKAILMFSLVFIVPTTCQALSCYPLQDNFFLQCTYGACSGVFRARQIGVTGACARRTIVEPIQDAEASLLSPMVASSVHDNKMTGYFHVLLIHQFYGHRPVTATELRDAMSQPGFPRTRLRKVEFIGNTVDVGALKQEWQNTQDNELRYYRMERLLDYISLSTCLAVLIFSIVKFRQWALNGIHGKSGLFRLVTPLTLQAVIFVLTLLPSIYFVSWATHVGLVPLFVCIIWCYELAFYPLNRLFIHISNYLGKSSGE